MGCHRDVKIRSEIDLMGNPDERDGDRFREKSPRFSGISKYIRAADYCCNIPIALTTDGVQCHGISL